MKTTLALVVFTLLIPVAASAQDGRMNLSFLDRLAERASEKQEVTIDQLDADDGRSRLSCRQGRRRTPPSRSSRS